MTTPASALSFHCMICFEEFHHENRYPVVLPCGHTYVCSVCAERLDKCPECRTLLTWTVPSANSPRAKGDVEPLPSWSTRRTGGRSTPSNQQAKPAVTMEKKRLPLPKNVVLLSLMEATELASEMAQTTTKIDSLLEHDPEFDDNVDDEEEKIKVSTSLTIGACGTYVVAEKEGLEVYPSRPSVGTEQETFGEDVNDMPSEEDVNALVRFFHLDHKLEMSKSEDNLKKAYSDESAPVSLRYGDRVQVVTFQGGWAKLARGYGFARADARQLVKVGGSVDRACRLEAYLHALAARRRELRAESGKVDTRFTRLMNNLQSSLFKDEDLTVISGDTFEEDDEGHLVLPQVEQNDAAIGGTFSEDSDLAKPYGMVRQPTPPQMEGLSCSMGSVFRVVSATLGVDNDELPQVASAPAAIGNGDHSTEVARARSSSTAESSQEHSIVASSRRSPPRTRELSAEAQAWRERYHQERQRASSIDFRTGLSGHQGLVSYMVHPHEYLNSHKSSLPKMSSHLGLSRSNRSTNQSWHPAPSYSYSRDSQM